MLKKFLFSLLFLLVFPIFVSAGQIDIPYYMGLVDDGSTTIRNGSWAETNKSCHFFNSDHGEGDFYDSPGDGRAVRQLDNGFVAVLYWWHDSAPGAVPAWNLDDASIFKVNQNTMVYYGEYNFEDEVGEFFDNPQRFSRELKTGETLSFNLSVGVDTWQMTMSFQKDGITFPNALTPGSTNLTNSILLNISEGSDGSSDYEISTEIWAPGVGPVYQSIIESEDGGDAYWCEMKDKITSWGRDNYPAYMTTDDVTTALATLNSLIPGLMSKDVVDVKPTSGSKVVVIPLN